MLVAVALCFVAAELPQRLQKKLSKPYLVVDGDLNDLRLYSEEQTRTNIEAFVEQLAEAKA